MKAPRKEKKNPARAVKGIKKTRLLDNNVRLLCQRNRKKFQINNSEFDSGGKVPAFPIRLECVS